MCEFWKSSAAGKGESNCVNTRREITGLALNPNPKPRTLKLNPNPNPNPNPKLN